MLMLRIRILSLLATLAVAFGAGAAQKAPAFDGAGTADNPYLLKTAADIMALAADCAGESGATSGLKAAHYEGVCFALANDIDMSEAEGFLGIGSAPVGSSSGASWYFAGIIDGCDHTISNMKIEGIVCDDTGKALSAGKTGSRSYVGFVGTLKSPGAIAHLHLDETCSVSGYTATGSIVGQAEAGTVVSDCTSAATVKSINKNSGGIIGYMKGNSSTPAMITRCVFAGSVMENYEASGGIAGRCERGIILKCANLGSITCQSFNSARAEGKQNLGAGIAGYNYFGIVQDCLNAGRIEVSYQKAGGIVGYNSNADCKVISCVNLGQIVSDDKQYKGAIVGHNFRSGTAANYKYGVVENCYYDTQLWGDLPGYQVPEGSVTPMLTRAFTSGDALEGLDPASWQYEADFYPRPATGQLSERIREAAATYVLFADGQSAADFLTTATVSTAMPGITASMAEGVWFKADGGTITALNPTEQVTDTILLANGDFSLQIPVCNSPVVFPGSGTADDPYIITSDRDLLLMANACNGPETQHYAGVHFRLDADIDMSAHTSFAGIASKATRTFNSERAYYFSGIFDGNGHTISGLRICGVLFNASGTALEYTEGSTGNVGLFGALGKGAAVRNLTIGGARIEGYYNTGGIAGYLDCGTTVENCRVIGSEIISYNKNAGGIAGATATETDASAPIAISGCIVSGSVKANSEAAGGIVGDSRADISACVNLADVSVTNFNACVATPKLVRAGGIAGSNCGNISRCLNMGNVESAWTEAGGIAGYNTNGYRMGNLTANISAGQVTTADVSNAGALIGLDFRLTTSQSSPIVIEANYYDNRYCKLRASGNMEKEGLTGITTAALTSGEALEGIDGAWSFAAGRYPLPAAIASDELALRAAATFITVAEPYALYNFGSSAAIASAMPLTATIEGSDVFAVADGEITAAPCTSYAEATLTLTNGDYTRTLTLVKAAGVLPGSGTAADPYIIATPDDFIAFASFMATNRFDFDGAHFCLAADLDFSNTEFTPAGTVSTYFNGTFDGRGHSIGGIYFDATRGSSPADAGLFGFLGQNATVRDVHITSAVFKAAATAGAIAGQCMGRIENCTVGEGVSVTGERISDSSAEAGEEIGGAAGRIYPGAVLSDITSSAAVTGRRMVGGIVGSSRDNGASLITGCTNEGSVTGTAEREIVIQGGQQVGKYVETMTGGIAGRFTGTISSSVNRGKVSSQVCDAVGGILGKAFIDASIEKCENYGEVHTANAYAGGIVGITTVTTGTDIHTYISECVNHGPVGGMTSSGGIAGVAANGCSITRSANHGEVHPLMGRAGGFIGETSGSVTVADCHNTADITASMLAAGIAGDVPTYASLKVVRSFNTGTITSGANGGAAGIANSTSGTLDVADCYNAGAVRSARFAGGIAGRCEGTTVARCYNAATVESTSDNQSFRLATGNIVADATAKATVTDCCYPEAFDDLPADEAYSGVQMLTNAEMFGCKETLGSAYVYNPLTLPMLTGLDASDAARAFAAWYLTDNASGTTALTLSELEGVEWSAEGPLSISGSEAMATGTGEVSLTATCGDFERTHKLTVTDAAGIGDIEQDTEGGTTAWYSIDGLPLDKPQPGQVAVSVTTYPDGRRTARVVRAAE